MHSSLPAVWLLRVCDAAKWEEACEQAREDGDFPFIFPNNSQISFNNAQIRGNFTIQRAGRAEEVREPFTRDYT